MFPLFLFPELRTDDRRIQHRGIHGGIERPLNNAGFQSHLVELDQIKRETQRGISSMDSDYGLGKGFILFARTCEIKGDNINVILTKIRLL